MSVTDHSSFHVIPDIPRRRFLAGLAAALAVPILPRFAFGAQENSRPERAPLEKLLSAEEWAAAQKSPMAMDLENYFGKGFSCAESMLMVSLRRLALPEDLVWAAAGFGGGLGKKDLCGFLTAGVMGLGHAAGTLEIEKKEAKKLCSKAVAEYWNWWKEAFPLHCADIRPPGSSGDICRRMGAISAGKLNALIDRLVSPSQ